ncbi:MAG: hypothetical protein R2822_22675 [Spirosomataceae bacterium]
MGLPPEITKFFDRHSQLDGKVESGYAVYRVTQKDGSISEGYLVNRDERGTY